MRLGQLGVQLGSFLERGDGLGVVRLQARVLDVAFRAFSAGFDGSAEILARFIGAANVMKGTAKDENHVAFAGATLRVVGAKLAAGQTAAVAIRQHDIALSKDVPQTMDNALSARVLRQVFLGASRDYLVAATDGTTLRVDTAPDNLVVEGAEVWLTLPPERCRALER